MTADQQTLYDEFASLNERAAYKEREAVILQQQLTSKNAEASALRERAKAIAKQLGFTS